MQPRCSPAPLQGRRRRSFEEFPLSRSSESQAAPASPDPATSPYAATVPRPGHDPEPVPARTGGGARPAGLVRFNSWARPDAEAALLECCGSRRWALRLAAHRPYPDLDALLAASDEAGYDLSPTDIAEALAGECAPCLHHDAPRAAHLALRAAHAAYESRFGHVFVICLDAVGPSQHVDHVLAGIRTRLAHDPDEERSLTAEEMRRLARGRIIELVAEAGLTRGPFRPGGAAAR